MSTENQKNYDGRLSRYQLAAKLLDLITPAYEAIQNARNDEMSFAPNDTVNPADFDNLKIKMSEIIRASWKLMNDNKEIT